MADRPRSDFVVDMENVNGPVLSKSNLMYWARPRGAKTAGARAGNEQVSTYPSGLARQEQGRTLLLAVEASHSSLAFAQKFQFAVCHSPRH